MALTTGAAVLIADGEEAVCFRLAREVRRLGLVPLVAADGERAIDLIHSYTGDVVAAVLDLGLARAGALTVTGRLAAARPDIPIVLTGAHHAPLADARHFPSVRVVLEKPFGLSAFTTCLSSFLDEAALRAG